MRVVNLASGSKGNSSLVEFEDTKILIDIGINEKRLNFELQSLELSLKDISAVFITHEHADHIASLEVLAKKYNMDFYIHRKLAESKYVKPIKFKPNKIHFFENEKVVVGKLEIQPFDISHDAIAPVGYVVNVLNSRAKVGFATDLGVVTEKVQKALSGVKLVFVESNHDEQMLLNGKYPYIIKRRILGEKGHLSNAQSLKLAQYLYDTGTRVFALSHISQNNNTPQLALSNYLDYFCLIDKNVIVKLTYQEKHGNNFIVKEEF